MKNSMSCSAPVPPKMRVSTLVFVIAALALMLTPVCAQVVPLIESNSSVLIDVASPLGMHAWAVDGVNQLNTQWWYYRISVAGAAPINAIGAPVATVLSPSSLSVLYSNPLVDLTVMYSLTGGADGSGNSTIAEVMRIKNKTTAPMAFHLFEYTDLNLNNTPDDDTAALLNSTTVGQWDGAIISTELASVGGIIPGPDRWEIANAQSLLAKLNSGAPIDLADATTPFAGDAAFSFQWDLNIPAGRSLLLSKSKVLMRGGAIGDTVWRDDNGDGTQDATEPGIAGVKVNLAADFDGDGVVDYTASTVTDTNGYYLFANLPAGFYTIDVDRTTLPAGAIQTYDYDGLATPDSATLTLADGEVNLDVDFGYQLLASVGDRVWDDLNRNGVQDAGEPGIDGVTMTLKDGDGNVVGTMVTSGDGNYLFTGLIPGDYTVYVDQTTLPPGLTQTYNLQGTQDYFTPVTLAGGDARTDVDFGYWEPASIGDRVWDDVNGNGVQDAGEPGINGVTLYLKDSGGAVIGSTTTAGDGIYHFNNLQAGAYTVSVDVSTLPAGMVQTYDLVLPLDNAATVTVAAGDNRTDVDFGYTGSVPSILIVKTGPATACIGDTITYHFKVTNTGNTTLYDVTVTDPLLGGVIWTKASMAPGEVAEFDKSYVVKAGDLTSGSSASAYSAKCWNPCPPPPPCPPILVNKVGVTGRPPVGPNVTSTSSWTTKIDSCNPKICLVKTGPATANIGDTITYHFKVTNTGNTILSNVTVNDPLLGGVIWTKASMAPGEVAEFDKTYVVKASDLTSGSTAGGYTAKCWNPCPPVLVNKATVTGSPATGQQVTSTSSWTTKINSYNPKICLVKTGPATANNGDTITYHFKVTNTGNTVLDITVDDPLLGGVIWHKDGVAPGAVNEFDHTYVVKVNFYGARCVTQPQCPGPQTSVVVNTATATGRPPVGCSVTSQSSCKTTVTTGTSTHYTTYTQGGWGAGPCGSNPGAVLKAHFSQVYPSGCVSIGGTYKIKFTGAWAIQAFLPQGGTPGKLRCSATNPTDTAAGVFAGQVLALRLNVDFSNAGVTAPGLGSVKLTSGKLAGSTIAQVLALAEQVLGGSTSALPAGMTISQLNDIVDGINNSYD